MLGVYPGRLILCGLCGLVAVCGGFVAFLGGLVAVWGVFQWTAR